MRKLISLLMAVALIMSLATVAFATETGDTTTTSNTDNVTASSSTTNITLKKLYTVTGAADVSATESAKVYPHETLSFVATPDGSNPTTQNLTIADLTVTNNGGTIGGTMAITLPAYTEIGVYKYTISETAGNAQAAVYASDSIGVTVLVSYNDDHTALVAELILTQANPGNTTGTSEVEEGVNKVDTFKNSYSVGQLDGKKTVSGNLASTEVEFEMTVKFTSTNPVKSDITVKDGSTNDVSTIAYGDGWTEKTVTINVKHGETVSFYNIPTGVSYEVVEAAKHGVGEDGFNANSDNDTDYDVSYTGEKGTISTSTSTATVNNDKSTSVETGIITDSAPYIILIAVCAVAAVLFVTKRRAVEF